MRPREMRARYATTCPCSGRKIAKGDWCLYYPLNRRAFHYESDTARTYRNRRGAQDEA